ncbi:MAG TPA: cupin domain-containing protein [Edaphobacter sp.]|nr:cupin domain-containing protein [Edaphobacter sp.]
MSDSRIGASATEEFSRRSFLGAGGVALATAALGGLTVHAQQQEKSDPASNPGQENDLLLRENPNSNTPPATDHGSVGPIWYSFDLTQKRIEKGGWTHEVTQRELPTSTEIAGVNMRLTAGSFRELHWHSADEWAFMLYGSARVTVLNPDGTIFIDDVNKGDLWFFPAGLPHSIQGLGPDGCEFLLVFDEGHFSEDNTFLLSEWIAHTPPEVLAKNLNLSPEEIAKLPKDELYIFPADMPKSLAEDRASVGGRSVQAQQQYTFKMEGMAPAKKTAGGEVRVVDSRNFPVSKSIAAGLVTVKPGGMRELHWHPNASEWQFYIAGKARMTVFMPTGRARTMDFNANDVGFVPAVAGHYVENTGDTDLVFLEMFKAEEFQDISLNNWIRRLPPEMITAHLNLDAASIRKIPADKQEILIS